MPVKHGSSQLTVTLSERADIALLLMVATVTRTMLVVEVARTCCSMGLTRRLPVRVRMLMMTTMLVIVVTDLGSSFTCRAARLSVGLCW